MRYTLLPDNRIGKERQEALSMLYSKLKGEFKRNYGLKVDKGELFNSGYYGLLFYIQDVKFYVIDQPGKVGLEDHSCGYISVQCGNKEQVLITHKDKGFGDVRINNVEREYAYKQIPEVLYKMYMQR